MTASPKIYEGSVTLPKTQGEMLNAEVTAHLLEVVKILRDEYSIYNVTVSAKTSIDIHGNRTAYVTAVWDHNNEDVVVSGRDGVYAAFNGGHRTYGPDRTAYSIKCSIRAIERKERKSVDYYKP